MPEKESNTVIGTSGRVYKNIKADASNSQNPEDIQGDKLGEEIGNTNFERSENIYCHYEEP